jgi:hypothetical protein
LACASGLSTNASASAYAIAYNNVFNLAIFSTPLFVPLSDFSTFSATSAAGANLDGSPDLGNLPNSDSAGGAVDATAAYGAGSVFPVAAPTNNAMTAQGSGGGNYAYADAQVSQTALTQEFGGDVSVSGELTQAWSIAEAYIAADGSADSSAINGSEVGFNSSISLEEATRFSFSFQADPYQSVALNAHAARGSAANANIDLTFSITSGGQNVFEWSPNGAPDGIVGGDEINDPFNLNGSVEVSSANDSAIFDPCGSGVPSGSIEGTCNGDNTFSARTDLLQPGIYTISLDMLQNIGISTRVATVVPAPGVLAMFGLALAGLGLTRRRRMS